MTCYSFSRLLTNLRFSAGCRVQVVREERKVSVPQEHFSFPVLMTRIIFSFPLKTLMVFFTRLPEWYLIDPLGSTVTYINMNTFHTIELFVTYCIKRPPQTHNVVLQATTSVKWPMSASTFVPVPYRWQNWLLAQALGSFWSNLEGKMVDRH